jgi:hypothetical protein
MTTQFTVTGESKVASNLLTLPHDTLSPLFSWLCGKIGFQTVDNTYSSINQKEGLKVG